MWTSRSFVALTALFSLAGLASADYDLIYPIVGPGDAGEDYSKDLSKWLQGQVMDVVDGQTTYLAIYKTSSYTIVIAENTYDMRYSFTYGQGSNRTTPGTASSSFRSACTFTGVPVTAAVCGWTQLSVAPHQTGVRSTEYHYAVPDTMGFSNIMYATLTVREGMATETDLSRSDVSEQGGSSKTAVASSGITSAPTPNRTVRVAKAGLPITSSIVSTGRAQGTAVPLVFGVGVAAGLVIGM